MTTEENKCPSVTTFLVDDTHIQTLTKSLEDVVKLDDSSSLDVRVSGIQAVITACDTLLLR